MGKEGLIRSGLCVLLCAEAFFITCWSNFKTFAELTASNPKANSPHYKIGFAVGLYVQGLKNVIPALADLPGEPVSFENYWFEIVHSDIANKSSHKIALTYLTNPDVFGDDWKFYCCDQHCHEPGPVASVTLRLQQGLSIVEWLETGRSTVEKSQYQFSIVRYIFLRMVILLGYWQDATHIV